jgi:hypothetical protein
MKEQLKEAARIYVDLKKDFDVEDALESGLFKALKLLKDE